MVLGLIPDCDLEGCRLGRQRRRRRSAHRAPRFDRPHHDRGTRCRRVEKIETAIEPRFQAHFVEAMAIPHKTAAYTELRKVVCAPRRSASPRRRRATRGRRGKSDAALPEAGGGRPWASSIRSSCSRTSRSSLASASTRSAAAAGRRRLLRRGRRMGPVTIACMWVAAWIGGASDRRHVGPRLPAQGITGIWYVLGIAIGCTLFGLTVARRVKQLGDGDLPPHLSGLHRAALRQPHARGRDDHDGPCLHRVLRGPVRRRRGNPAGADRLELRNCLLLAGAIVTLYTAAGGYLAVTFTDRCRSRWSSLGIVAVGIPSRSRRRAAEADMRAVLPAAHYDFRAQGWDRVAALVVSMVLSFFVAMDSFSRSFAARDAAAAQRGALLAPVLMLPIALAVALARPRRGRALPGPGVERQHPRDVRPRSLPGGAEGPDGHRHPVGRDVGRVHQRAHGLGELRARHSPALPAAGHHARGDAADRRRWPRLGARRAVLLMAWKMRDIIDILQLGFTHQLGRALPADDRGAVDGPDARRPPRSGAQPLARNGHRLARRGRCRRGRHFTIDPAVAGLFVSAVLLHDRRMAIAVPQARCRDIVVAEMPEAEGRDLSIERRHLPAARARRDTSPIRGDRDALVAACRGRRCDPDGLRALRSRRARRSSQRCRHHLGHRRRAGIAWTSRAAAERGIRVAAVGEYCTERSRTTRSRSCSRSIGASRTTARCRTAQLALERGAGLEAARRPDALGSSASAASARPSGRRALGFGMKVARLRSARGCRRPCVGFGAELCKLDELLARRTSSACTATWTRAAADCSIARPSTR